MSHVVVVGAGNAGLCAALAAAEQGARVTVLERAPPEERGGNSAFTAGAMRVAYDGVDDLRRLMPDLTEAEIADHRLRRLPGGRRSTTTWRGSPSTGADPDLAEILVNAQPADRCEWMRYQGVRFGPIYGRAGVQGGRPVQASGAAWRSRRRAAARAWSTALHAAGAKRPGIEIRYGLAALHAARRRDGVDGVRAVTGGTDGRPARQRGRAGLRRASRPTPSGAPATSVPAGTWPRSAAPGSTPATASGWPSTWARRRTATGPAATPWAGTATRRSSATCAVGDGFQKHSYPFGIMVNADGQRFVDEGADFRNYTYAKYGREILGPARPVRLADLRREGRPACCATSTASGRSPRSRRTRSRSSPASWTGVDPDGFLATVKALQRGRDDGRPVQSQRQGRPRTAAWRFPKSNWANRLDTPPFEAYAVTCGITFTFGGLRIDPRRARCSTIDGQPIPGLFACGRAGRRAVLLQLSRGQRPHLRRRLRPPRRHRAGRFGAQG